MSGPERTYRPGDDFGRLFRRLVRAAERFEGAAMAAAKMPRAQGRALLAIASMARPSMAMLARELDLAPSTATRLLDPLAHRGLVEREVDREDRRVVVVTLTANGRRIAREIESGLENAYGRMAALSGETGGAARLQAAARDLLAAFDRTQPRTAAVRGRTAVTPPEGVKPRSRSAR
jgi:DNA-binding MarR family transcriptional regulator